jgi:CRP-like cAMP-binding protein
MVEQNAHLRNRLLASLSADDFSSLEPHLRPVAFFPGDLLHRPGEPISQVYFLNSGIVSLMAILEGGTMVETVSVGYEGAVGTIEGFGPLHAFTSARVQVAGAASRISGPAFQRLLDESASLTEAINHYHMTVMAHVQQTSACNTLHNLTSRLSRNLLLAADRCDDHIQLTQEALAEILGVRRSSVTESAKILRDVGAIKYRRANIKIANRAKLEEAVCECYPTIRRAIDLGFRDPWGREPIGE